MEYEEADKLAQKIWEAAIKEWDSCDCGNVGGDGLTKAIMQVINKVELKE